MHSAPNATVPSEVRLGYSADSGHASCARYLEPRPGTSACLPGLPTPRQTCGVALQAAWNQKRPDALHAWCILVHCMSSQWVHVLCTDPYGVPIMQGLLRNRGCNLQLIGQGPDYAQGMRRYYAVHGVNLECTYFAPNPKPPTDGRHHSLAAWLPT